jgi:serine/threonine protein kinase
MKGILLFHLFGVFHSLAILVHRNDTNGTAFTSSTATSFPFIQCKDALSGEVIIDYIGDNSQLGENNESTTFYSLSDLVPPLSSIPKASLLSSLKSLTLQWIKNIKAKRKASRILPQPTLFEEDEYDNVSWTEADALMESSQAVQPSNADSFRIKAKSLLSKANMQFDIHLQNNFGKLYKRCDLSDFWFRVESYSRFGRITYQLVRKSDLKRFRLVVTEYFRIDEFHTEVFNLFTAATHSKAHRLRGVFPTIQCIGYQTSFVAEMGAMAFEQANYFITDETLGVPLWKWMEDNDAKSIAGTFSRVMDATLHAVSQLHKLGFIYLNGGDAAFMVDSQLNVQLVDFRQALFLGKTSYMYKPGTVKGRAPELSQYETASSVMSAKTDLYELGVLFAKVYDQTLRNSAYEFVPKFGFEHLIKHMTKWSPEQRPDFEQALVHPFFRYFGHSVPELLYPKLSSPECDFSSFTVVKKLSGGSDAFTFLVKDDSNEELKVLKVGHELGEGIWEEVLIMDKLQDKTLAPNMHCYHLRGPIFVKGPKGTLQLTENEPAFVMDFIDGQTLAHYWDHFSYSTTPLEEAQSVFVSLFKHMLKILVKLHKENIVHLDPHVNNWMLDKRGTLFLIDFSRGRDLESAPCDTSGHPPEINPQEEGRRDFGQRSQYTKASDVYALAHALEDVYDLFFVKEYGLPGIPPQLASLFKWMKATDPLQRPSLEQALEHAALNCRSD